jgi:hypothetical protein
MNANLPKCRYCGKEYPLGADPSESCVSSVWFPVWFPVSFLGIFGWIFSFVAWSCSTESQTYVQFMLGVFHQFIQGLRSLW